MATFEQLQLFGYVKELWQLDAVERLRELERKIESAQRRLAELEQRRGPGRPRKVGNG